MACWFLAARPSSQSHLAGLASISAIRCRRVGCSCLPSFKAGDVAPVWDAARVRFRLFVRESKQPPVLLDLHSNGTFRVDCLQDCPVGFRFHVLTFLLLLLVHLSWLSFFSTAVNTKLALVRSTREESRAEHTLHNSRPRLVSQTPP